MSQLIKGLLNYSRVTTCDNPLTRINLNRIIEGVVSDLELKIAEYNAKIEISDMPDIKADGTQIRQLFQNLIGNALKFHSPETLPEIRIYSVENKSDGHHRLIVEDNGRKERIDCLLYELT